MDATVRKRNGVHYTPVELADFLARRTTDCLFENERADNQQAITILDPACGDGQLLGSLIACLRRRGFEPPSVLGFDTDPIAVEQTQTRLSKFELSSCDIQNKDFLNEVELNQQVDCVIANPPYVRTQILGSRESQRLSKKFRLKGRVDLYHAFAVAIHDVLKPEGAMGLLTSNRFLSIKFRRTDATFA